MRDDVLELYGSSRRADPHRRGRLRPSALPPGDETRARSRAVAVRRQAEPPVRQPDRGRTRRIRGGVRRAEECLDRAMQEFRPDLVHSHHLWLLTSLVRRRFPGLPVVASCHGSDLRQFRNCPHLRERVLAGCRRLDAVTVLSRAMRSEVCELYGLPAGRVHVVGAGYDERVFFRPQAKPAPRPVRLLYAGKLSRAKGVPWLLRSSAAAGTGNVAPASGRVGRRSPGPGVPGSQASGLGPPPGAGDGARRAAPGRIGLVAALVARVRAAFVLRGSCRWWWSKRWPAAAPSWHTDLPGVRELAGEPGPEALRRVGLPRLENEDRPLAADQAGFEARLAEALQAAIDEHRAGRRPRPAELEPILAACRWQEVFARIQGAWAAAR